MSQAEKDFLKSQTGDTIFFDRYSCEVVDFRRLRGIIEVQLRDVLGVHWVRLSLVCPL